MVELGEHPRVFGRHRNLIGLLTEPLGDPDDSLPAVVLLNAGIIHRVGPSRMAVEVARTLARAGCRVLRFDLSGLGDSRLASEGTLQAIVQDDVRDAVELVAGSGRGPVVLLGLCSGADNAFFVAAQDSRVAGLVLIDPTVHRTGGFFRRRALERLRKAGFWAHLLSGRFLVRRLRARARRSVSPPPGYYGLLVSGPEETRSRAAAMTDRGVAFLYVLTGGVRDYCNSPAQIEESMPGCFHGNLRTEWRPLADHLLSRAEDRKWLVETVVDWLRSRDWRQPIGPERRGSLSGVSRVASQGAGTWNVEPGAGR